MYTLYRSPAAFYECLVAVVITLLRTTAAQKIFCINPCLCLYYTFAYFFWILYTIEMKFGQILVCCMKNISNKFLAQFWNVKARSKRFYDFIKMAV